MEDPFIEILVFFRHLGWEALAPRESVTSVAVVLHLAHHQIAIWVSLFVKSYDSDSHPYRHVSSPGPNILCQQLLGKWLMVTVLPRMVILF